MIVISERQIHDVQEDFSRVHRCMHAMISRENRKLDDTISLLSGAASVHLSLPSQSLQPVWVTGPDAGVVLGVNQSMGPRL